MKRLLSFLFLMLLPLMASADAVEIDGIYYEFDNENQEASVVRNPNCYAGDVEIPEKVSFDGTEYTVTAIEGAAFGNCDGLTSVIIPKSVTFIGEYAFSRCKSLTAIVLPDALERIDHHAFFMSENLSTLNIPAGVTYIGACAFSGCPITDYTIPKGITAIEHDTFNGTAASSVIIPNKVKSIGAWAFRNCSNLESVVIPAAVTSIEEKAFGDCDNLTSVTVYIKSPLAIPEDAFSNRINATLVVPAGCKEDYLATDYWKEFKEIVEMTVPEPYAVLSEDNTKLTFYYDSNKEAMGGMDVGPFIYAGGDRSTTSWFDQRATITTAVFDESFADCTSITNTAYWFYGCNKLVTISGLENLNMGNVEKMDCMFCGCSSIETLDLSSFNTENVKNFFSVFTNCSSLTSLNVSQLNTENATDMRYMFNGCSSLTSLDVSNFNTGNVTNMYGMFNKCSSLTSLDLSHFDMSKVTDVSLMFNGCSALTTIYCNNAWSCEQSGSMFSGCTSLVGAISFDRDMTDATCANPTTGYFTITGGLPGFEVGDVFIVGRMTYIVTSTNPLEAQVSSGKYWTPAIDKSTEGAVVIPSSVIGEDGNTYAVTSIGSNAFVECSGITSVTIPGSVTSIGVGAFMSCSGLTSVIIPDRATSIAAQAFSGCSGLTSLTIGNSVTTIDKNAFSGCIGLTSVTIPKSVTTIGGMDKYTGGYLGAFPGCSGIVSIKVEEGNPMYDSREDCNAIIETATNTLIWGCKNTVIPDDVASIGDNAFLNCTGLTSVSIPISVTSIQAGAFEGCTGLTSITIPNSVTSLGTNRLIGGLSFIYNNEIGGGSNLTSVTVEIIDPSVAPGDNTVFTDVENAILYVPKGCKTAFEASDSWNNFKEIVETDSYFYPPYEVDDVFTVDGMTFMVTSIEPLEARVGKGTLNGMNGSPAIDVTTEGTIVIPSSVTGNDGKSYAVTSIGAAAFADCSGVTSVIIPNSVTAISGGFDWGGSAFAGGAFENCGLTTLTIPSTVTSIGQGAFSGCSNLVSIVVEEGNTVYDSRNNCNAIIVKETNALIAGCKNTVIPDGVTSIGNGAFSGCKGLTSLELPSSVTYIGPDGFMGCSDLTSIGISGVTYIDYGAFEGCSALTSIVIPEGVTSIWQYTFYGCSSLTTITIPKGMKWIGRNTYTGFFHNSFWGCSSLTDFYCYAEEVPEANAKVFEGSNIANATLYVPAGCSEAYASAEGWKDFKEIKEFVNDESATYIVEDDKSVTIINEIASTEKEIEVPASVTIGEETYPVTGIGEKAYASNTIMEQVTIPETIEKIGDAAFAGCTSLKVIYSYAKEPIPLGSAKAKVRTRADGEEISASTVFAEVDKETCVLYVPAGSADKYKAADGWSEFKNIVEMDSDILGDANNDGKVDADDIDAITRYIMEGDDEGFVFKNADVNGDEKINAADIVEVVNIIKPDK